MKRDLKERMSITMPAIDITQFRFFQKIIALPYVDRIILYGSRARKDNRARSDIDLAIDCPRATQLDWSTILGIIEENNDTLLSIDCIRYDTYSDNDPFKQTIAREGVLLYKKEQ
jgi:predicted nucleotidyltransferase